MAIRLLDRLGRLAEIVEMAELVRDPGQGPHHRLADALLAVGDRAGDGHRQGLAHLGDQESGAVDDKRLLEEDLPGDAIAQDPEDLVADVGLEA